MVDSDETRTSHRTVTQQRLAVLDGAAAQIVVIEVEKVEGEMGELLRAVVSCQVIADDGRLCRRASIRRDRRQKS